jgi:ubiquinone/menaquinone biosynthesis C-methylase UbiE
MAERLTLEQIKAMNELQRRYFNENVDIFEPPLPKGVPARLRATVQAGGLRPGEKVLDVGTGTGILIPYILKYRPSEIHACDIAEKMLERVKQKFPRVIAHLGDISDLPLPDDSLDVAFINGCFSNILDKAKSLDNLYRLLRPKGRLVISHPMGRNFIVELKQHTPFHLDLLPDEAEARELLARYDFEVLEFRDDFAFYLVVAKTRKQEAPSATSIAG